MKIVCDRTDLTNALATTGKAIPHHNTTLPVLTGAHFTTDGTSDITVTGTDLQTTIQTRIETSEAPDAGEAVIPHRILSDLVKAADSETVTIMIDGDQAEIVADEFRSTIRLLPADEYPRTPDVTGDTIKIDAAGFLEGLKRTLPAAGTDVARPILTGLLMSAEDNGLRLVATDSYRLAVSDHPGNIMLGDNETVLVPAASLRDVAGFVGDNDTLGVLFGDRWARFTTDTVTVTTQLLEGDFPAYKKLIPTDLPNHLRVDPDVLTAAVKRVQLMARELNTPLRLTFNPTNVVLAARTHGVGEATETVDAEYIGEPDMTVGFNPKYLIDALTAYKTIDIQMSFTGQLKPVVVRPCGHPDYIHLLMPVRLA